ncbi:MAG: hypothetical protein ACKVRP_02425 [Bacteroidota bacterium]
MNKPQTANTVASVEVSSGRPIRLQTIDGDFLITVAPGKGENFTVVIEHQRYTADAVKELLRRKN